MRRSEELEFANDVARAIEDGSPRIGRLQLLVIMGLLGATLAWAQWAQLDEVTTGIGRVIPASQTQVLQSLEGGIVREILVKEGTAVEREQAIMRIDDTSFSSRLGELNQRRLALRAELNRLEAEATQASEFSFDKAVEEAAPSSVAAERAIFAAHMRRLNLDLVQIELQLLQRELELSELDARRMRLEAILTPLKRELELNRQLAGRGNAAAVDILRLERQLADVEGEIKVLAASTPRVWAAIEEARTRRDGFATMLTSQARERQGQVLSELAIIEESIKAAQDRVVRTAVRSPVRGVVNKLAVATIGAVVQPGQPLADIVPLDDALLIEARVRPKDVAFVRPGQRATVKFTAYDYLIYGSLDGEVERISADTIRDEKNEMFYQVIIKMSRGHLGTDRERFMLIPGLVATVDILTGHKSVLDYILKPILRARHEAMRER